MTQHEQAGKDGSQIMHKVLIKYYDKLTSVLNTSIMNLSRYFVANNLITPEDEDEIFNATRDKARIFLLKIEAPVKGGFTAGLHLMLDIMLQHGSVTDIQLAEQIKNEIDEEYKIEKLEKETKEVDVVRQEHINSLTLRLKRESDQKAVVEQLQQKIAEEDTRHKQMDYNLDKEKENNRRLYEQYLKTLKELQNLHHQHKVYIRNKIDYENRVSKELKSLKAEKTNTLQYVKEIKKQAATFEQDFKKEQQKCNMKDTEISSLKDQLQAAEVGLKKDNEEWWEDYDALKKKLELLKEKNEELEKQNSTMEQEVDDLKAQVQAAELALAKDDEEWRQDYNKISVENKSLAEEIDSLKQNIGSLQQEKDTLETENDKVKEENKALKTEKESVQGDLDAVLLSHEEDNEEWRLKYQRLVEKYYLLKLENDKLLKQQLEVALIGRRTSIEQLEDMETSLQVTTQENAVLKVANEEAEREIMLLNNDKSTIAALEVQSKTKEIELTAANESLNRELTEVKAKLVGVSEENQRLHQSLFGTQKQWSLPQQSLYNELNNIKLRLTKTTAEKEMMRKMYNESLSKANMLQSDLLSIKTQLVLQKELQERDAKLLQIKGRREEEMRATIERLNHKIELLEEDRVKVKQTHGTITRIDHSQQHTTVSQGVNDNDDSCKEDNRPDNKMNNLLTSDPMQSLSASLYQLRASELTAKSNETIFSHPVPQATTTSLKLSSTSDLVEHVLPASNSLPSLQSDSASALYVRKSVSTAKGEDTVMCKQIINVTDLSCGQRVVIQQTNDKYEYGTVRAFPEYISGNINFVGIELDLPNGISDGSADNVYYFDCKPNHGLFVPVDKLFKAVYTIK